MIKLIASLFLILSFHVSFSQISGMWHSSVYDSPFTDYSMKLKGNVKSWRMVKSNGKSRTITYDENGDVTSDTYSGTIQTFIPPDYKAYKLKIELEKSYPINKSQDSLCTYNNRMQLLERRGNNYFEKNYFDDSGRILIHQQTYTTTQTRAWNSIHHTEPTYTYTVKTGALAFFKYNSHGSLTEISYFNSNPDHNLKLVYLYDESNNMIETNRYDSYNIRTGNKPDNYIDTIMKSKIDTSFSIEKFHPRYWDVGKPAVNKWRYNSKRQKIEYIAYGYKPNGGTAIISFIAKWEYDKHGYPVKEIHYNVWKDRIDRIIEFDEFGNVVKETKVGYDGIEDVVSEMKIEYF